MNPVAPRSPEGFIVAGLRGGSGKTIISLGITGALAASGKTVAPFKKGPDYIDAGWLSKAAGRPCYNLDTFLCKPEVVRHSFLTHSQDADIAVIEGNRGLYDGIDTDGSTSTAELAKLLNLPVLLVLDCTKSTRTMAALLKGCIDFDPDLNICGVILNRVAGKRHEGKVRTNIERFCKVPVFGAIPKLKQEDFPERHMGLMTSEEHAQSSKAIETAVNMAQTHIELEALYDSLEACAAATSPQHVITTESSPPAESELPGSELNIGIIRDSAFQFYYPDNIEALKRLGARITYISPLTHENVPPVDAVYMGGGFPETHAHQLAQNQSFKEHFRKLAVEGLPIYAECGGLIFLGKAIHLKDSIYPMAGILPITFGLANKPQGHGYTEVEVVHENPFYQKGETLKGHEFRYSKILDIDYTDTEMAFRMGRGKGIIEKKDGFFKYNTLGTYTHIHALGTPSWASAFINKARDFKATS